MPYSERAGKQFTKDIFEFLKPVTVLDIGAGAGTYSKLMRDKSQHWTALEVWEPYISKYNLTSLYDEVILSDIRLWQPVKSYNFSILGDVLEHMTLEESKLVVEKIRKLSDYTVISIPFGTNPQGDVEENYYERHIEEYWDEKKVRDTFGTPILFHIETGDWCTMGVFIYPKIF
jgi:hypothetical protein